MFERVCYLSAFTPKFEDQTDLNFCDEQWNVTNSCFEKHFLRTEKMNDADKKKLAETTKRIIVRDHMTFLFVSERIRLLLIKCETFKDDYEKCNAPIEKSFQWFEAGMFARVNNLKFNSLVKSIF